MVSRTDMSSGDLTVFVPDPRATMPTGWQTRTRGPDDDCVVNCIVLCGVHCLGRPVECCCGTDDPVEQPLSKCPLPKKEREESRACSQRLQVALGRVAHWNATNAGGCRGPIAFVGDSDVEWWEPWHLTSWKVSGGASSTAIPAVNIGVGGGNLQDLLLRAEEIDAQLRPSVYVVICGENSLLGEPDCSQGHAVGMLRALLTPTALNGGDAARFSLVRRPRSHLRHVIFFGAKRTPGTRFMHKKHVDYNQEAEKMFAELNAKEAEAFPQFAHLHPRFVFHDSVDDAALTDPKTVSSLYRVDGLHLSKKGCMVLNNRLQKILQEQVSLENLPPAIAAANAPEQQTIGNSTVS
eukprot:g12141.t1